MNINQHHHNKTRPSGGETCFTENNMKIYMYDEYYLRSQTDVWIEHCQVIGAALSKPSKQMCDKEWGKNSSFDQVHSL